ncbi:hypothetical protein OPS25_13955 [Alteromonas ponticola]|uniref:Uncharacterized protein n=1 Tax=Alteromonas aquimaris TaxID=2998417 RepID=A0ABT3PA75_9ALTE|nr:hypothetical protein [Alteromonas aquimaris]MCW8109609.1 hypothetical protein [Alteromonas aquimaris]
MQLTQFEFFYEDITANFFWALVPAAAHLILMVMYYPAIVRLLTTEANAAMKILFGGLAISLILSFSIIGFVDHQVDANYAKAIKDYKIWLSTLNADTVKKLAKSAELSQKSKEVVIEYLNENHPGWSLE